MRLFENPLDSIGLNATITFETNTNTVGSPTWTDIGANTLVFAGSQTDLTSPIVTTSWNDGTHVGSDDPGTDACNTARNGAGGPNSNHNNNVKYVASGTASINSAATENLNDTNLIAGECTLRIHLNNASTVATQNTFAYTFDGAVTTNEAVGIECYAFEQGVTATAWTQVNDDSANVGGNNSGERLDLGEKTTATDHYWYLALSARGETAGAKTSFDLGVATEVFGVLLALGISSLLLLQSCISLTMAGLT